ncbi:MAG: maleylpyruvate isomerase family mycothiol-dependent enzyme [Actinomycetota bacterium]|nr:maleylpyruvate isomerase family mycothiol-dependent enzyme [Actinomycetota bacterium]
MSEPVLGTERWLSAIEDHSVGFAESARDHLDAPVEHCPGWDVAELVTHLTQVHWFWRTIAGEQLVSPPEESRRPAPVARDELVAVFERGAAELVRVLREADQDAPCWTWSTQRDVRFITRHQVQETAVHHWDAANAAGHDVPIATDVATDAVAEFLAFSTANAGDPAPEPMPELGTSLTLRCSDSDGAWTLTDVTPADRRTTALSVAAGASGDVVVEAPADRLLLWLYGRVELDGATAQAALVERFRGFTFTD